MSILRNLTKKLNYMSELNHYFRSSICNMILALFLLGPITIYSQHHGGQYGGNKGSHSKHSSVSGEIYGRIIDANTKKPMEYATVSLLKSEDNTLVTGSISESNGKFDLLKVKEGTYRLSISFIGYTDYIVEDIVVSKSNPVHNLGDIVVSASVVLDEVVIDGKTPIISYEIDKKIIDISRMNTDLSQTAVEILENVPSISVSDDGTINMRGSSSFTLLIDGKPTAMDASEALTTIPASMIKNIELITNPSAKYDAEGVSGIINIVLKQNKLKGISLLTNINGGTFNNFGGDIAINFREKKHGLNITASHNNRNRPRTRTSDRTRDAIDYLSRIHSDEDNLGMMKMGKVSAEYIYEPNTSHSVIIGGTYNTFSMNSDNHIEYSIYRDDALFDFYKNEELGTREFFTYNANLTYRYNIKRIKTHYLEFKSVLSSWDGEELLLTDYLDEDDQKFGGTKRTETGPSNVLRFNLDYSKKSDLGKFETGLQLQYGLSSDDSDNYEYNPISKVYDYQEIYSKDVTYARDIAAAYALYGNKKGKFGYQLGFRLEHTLRNISATNSPDYTSINRFDYFPSAHFSYQLTDDQDILFNYSRRINRPRSYYFEPFITWYSAYDIASGNPELKPEYIDAFEINWIKKLGRKGNIGMELYYRNIKNLIERTETIYEDDILIRLPINIGKARSIGLTASTSYKLNKWWKSDLSFNLYQYSISGEIKKELYESESFNWDSRWTNTFTIKGDWRLQFVSNYHSKTTTVQGYQNAFISFNASVKKSFYNGKYSLTLQGRNIFGTRKNDSYIFAEGLTVHSIRIPKSPMVSLTFSMRLNNYKSRRRNVEVNDI